MPSLEPLLWPRLLSQRRFPDQQLSTTGFAPVRGAFVADYDRVVFSSAFRRLQRKTQVMPLHEIGFGQGHHLSFALEAAEGGAKDYPVVVLHEGPTYGGEASS